jgi:hypothetical protein
MIRHLAICCGLALGLALLLDAAGMVISSIRTQTWAQFAGIGLPEQIDSRASYSFVVGIDTNASRFHTRLRLCPTSELHCKSDITRNHSVTGGPTWAYVGSVQLPKGTYDASLYVMTPFAAGSRTVLIRDWSITSR